MYFFLTTLSSIQLQPYATLFVNNIAHDFTFNICQTFLFNNFSVMRLIEQVPSAKTFDHQRQRQLSEIV